eukprot:6411276-Amphidinium_carterae.1
MRPRPTFAQDARFSTKLSLFATEFAGAIPGRQNCCLDTAGAWIVGRVEAISGRQQFADLRLALSYIGEEAYGGEAFVGKLRLGRWLSSRMNRRSALSFAILSAAILVSRILGGGKTENVWGKTLRQLTKLGVRDTLTPFEFGCLRL